MDKPVHSRVQRIWLFLKIKNTHPLMGAKFKSNKHLYHKIFWFFAPFLARLASKFEKSTNMTKKKIFFIREVIKKRRISCWFQIRCKSFSKCTEKGYRENKFDEQQIWNQRAFLCFLIPFFLKKKKKYF